MKSSFIFPSFFLNFANHDTVKARVCTLRSCQSSTKGICSGHSGVSNGGKTEHNWWRFKWGEICGLIESVVDRQWSRCWTGGPPPPLGSVYAAFLSFPYLTLLFLSASETIFAFRAPLLALRTTRFRKEEDQCVRSILRVNSLMVIDHFDGFCNRITEL